MIEKRFVTSNLIIKAHRREGFESFMITGRKGHGKTCYAVKCGNQIIQEAYGCSEDVAWEEVLKCMFFDKKDVINFLRKHSGDPAPVMIWDDARFGGSGMNYITNPKATMLLLGLFDTIRTSCSGLMLTAPSSKGLLYFLKKEQGYKVIIHKTNNLRWRVGKGYLFSEIPSGIMRISPRFIDTFHFKIPDWVYVKVKAMRKHYTDIIMREIEESIIKSTPEGKKQWLTQLKKLKA